MTKEYIIKEYIPFMVKRVLKNCEPPKNEEELIEFSRELGNYILDRFGNEKETLIKAGQQFKIDSIEELKEAHAKSSPWCLNVKFEIKDFLEDENSRWVHRCKDSGQIFLLHKYEDYETIPNPFKKEDPIREELKALREEVGKLKGEKEEKKEDGVYIPDSVDEIKRHVSANLIKVSSLKRAYAIAALADLVEMRDASNGDWRADWGNQDQIKYSIELGSEQFDIDSYCFPYDSKVLSFKSQEIAQAFLKKT